MRGRWADGALGSRVVAFYEFQSSAGPCDLAGRSVALECVQRARHVAASSNSDRELGRNGVTAEIEQRGDRAGWWLCHARRRGESESPHP